MNFIKEECNESEDESYSSKNYTYAGVYEQRWRSFLTEKETIRILTALVITNIIAIGCPPHYINIFSMDAKIFILFLISFFLGIIIMLIINLFTWNLKLNKELSLGIKRYFAIKLNPIYYFVTFNGLNLALPWIFVKICWPFCTCIITVFIMFYCTFIFICGVYLKKILQPCVRCFVRNYF